MNTCATCKHWDREDTDLQHGLCERISMVMPENKYEIEDTAFVIDGSGYLAQLWTKPDFGCTLWEGS